MDGVPLRVQKRLTLIGAMLLVGCADQYSIPSSFPAASLAKAGTLLVSPTMVAPWDEVSATLKPAFALTGDQAATQVLPTTEAISEQVLSAFGASLAAGLPSTSATSQTIVGGANAGSTSTVTKAPGTPPAIVNTLPSAASLPAGSAPNTALGLDPTLKYKAANYLLQEVQLLNQEIDNAAARSCYVPYIVKLKLDAANFRPRLPYSIHAHIGFFFNGALQSNTRESIGGAIFETPSAELAPECRAGGVNPAVIPFLAADDMQVALRSRAAEAASQIAFGLSALVHGAGIAANASSLHQALTGISSRDLSSSLTVGRESESSLYVTITANNQSSNDPALTSETYDVAVLLLIPRFYFGGAYDPQSPIISVSTFSEYRNATSGEILADGSPAALVEQADRIVPLHLTANGLKTWNSLREQDRYDEAKRLADAIKVGSPEALMDRVKCRDKYMPWDENVISKLCLGDTAREPTFDSRFPSEMWVEFASLLDYDSSKLAMFQAQLPSGVKLPSQQILLNDDGTHPVQAVIGGVSARSAAKLGAFLQVTPFDVKSWKGQKPIAIPAQSLVLDTTAHTLTLTFPSLKKMNITCLSPVVIPARPQIVDNSKQKPVAGKPEKSPDPPCPSDASNATSTTVPNGIDLRLVGCDITKQICPSLTQTVFDADGALAAKAEVVSNWQRLVDEDVVAKTKLVNDETDDLAKETKRLQGQKDADSPAIARLQNKIQLDEGRLDAAKQLAQAATKRAENLRVLTNELGALIRARSVYTATSLHSTGDSEFDKKPLSKRLRIAETLGLDGFLDDYAILGISLYAPAQPSDPPSVALSNLGSTIEDDQGAGQLTFTIAPTPATDTISISIKGASLKSVVDGADAIVPYTAKHGFVLPQAGVYTLSLTGLNSKIPVVLSVQALKGDATDGPSVTQSFQVIEGKPTSSQAGKAQTSQK